ncbi:unnamed protein product [Adineta ricciae]|uniref:Uncharacterized protein n=1 Tax=Adineta ricciae TaxID=249248 RepID=A0A814FAS9_ADIRI|nr:unnamed protein product [Adineta ricciae]CAF0979131.1 unnamed protein product [Adineta ricciae]
MANTSGDSPLINPDKPLKLDEQATSVPAFPNTRWMNVTTDFSRNPGILDDVFKKIKDLMPPTFEGAKLSVTKMLSSHFQVSHSMTLSSGSNCGYKFGANYVGTQLYSQSEIFPVILGDADPNGNANAQIIHQWNDKLRTRILAQVQSFKMAGYQVSMDYRTPYTSTTLTLANIDLITNSGIAILQHLTRVTKNLDIGAEIVYQANPMMPGGHIGINSFVARYRGLDWFTGAKISPIGALNIGYFHQKTNSPLQLGVELEASLASKETSATFSYQYDLGKANTTFRGMVDTNGLVTAVIEKRLAPLPFTFMLSSSLNHAKAAYRFGIGLLIG